MCILQDPAEKDYTGTTAFHKAAANGHIDILKVGDLTILPISVIITI